ncbi:pyridoxal-phosphate dependent enzyme [Actinopolyspora sp. H202]|uniref:pyridoxal-phosphate dependent enzyme n=1 Tax=Actinopolyspora sp. H202 TaxID=1500456 RepID=UPI003EE68452
MSVLDRPLQPASDWAAASALPRLVDLGGGLVGAAFDIMKTLPALTIIDRAIQDGAITSRTTVAETTSGTFGLGLAIVCATRGLPLHLVSDPAIEGFLRTRIEMLGARVTVVEHPDPVGGYQTARLRVLSEIAKSGTDVFVPRQYDNPLNPRAYTSLARLIVEQVGIPHALVGSVGSGGSMCGTISSLRTLDPQIHAHAIDTHASVLFGQSDGPRSLRGLGNSVQPPNLDQSFFDNVHWVSAELAYSSTLALHREHALYMGPTSGAAYLIARWLTREKTNHRPVIVLLPDTGHRYEDTVHDPNWIREQYGEIATLPTAPSWVSAPRTIGSGWEAIRWNRRYLSEVVSQGDLHE